MKTIAPIRYVQSILWWFPFLCSVRVRQILFLYFTNLFADRFAILHSRTESENAYVQ